MGDIKVSVIIPVYNVEHYLKECMDSIINQSLRDLEIICINDGSTDNSLNILKNYQQLDNRIKIINQENHGQGYARNVGLSQVVGKYVYFMDADDYLELTALEELYNLAENKSLDLIIFKLINFHDENRETFQTHYYEMEFLRQKVGENVFNYTDVRDDFLEIAVSPPGKLFKRDIISNVKFPEDLIFEDNPFFFEAFLNAKRIYFYNKHLYYRRIRGDSTTGNPKRFSDAIGIANEIIDRIKKLGLFHEFNEYLYNKKLNQIVFRYDLVDEEHKYNFFTKMKNDFLMHKSEYEQDSAFKNINPRLKNAFYSCISSDTYKEFNLHLSIFNQNNEIDSLKQTNENLSNRITSLEEQLNTSTVNYQELTRDITNLENVCSNLKNQHQKLYLNNLRLTDSNNYFKNQNSKLQIENKNLKSTKSYKLATKYNNIKHKLS